MRAPIAAGAVLALLLLAAGFELLRPLPAVAASPVRPAAVAGSAPSIPCPATGSAAVAVDGIGTVQACGAPAPAPMYSTAKIMTALLVLRDHPLAPGAPGPSLTVTQAQADLTSQEAAANASVVPVDPGEPLTELQLLEGLLIPSGNNFAEILAGWDGGTVGAFVQKMNATAAAMGLRSTRFADPSGFSEQTVSVPADLLRLAEAAMHDPVFAALVGMRTAELPVAGTVYNVDSALDHDGIAGIKTGSSPQGTASFAGLSLKQVAGQPAAIYSAVMGEPDLPTAFRVTESLAAAAAADLVVWRPFGASRRVGAYRCPWGGGSDAVATQDLALLAWPGRQGRVSFQLAQLAAPAPAGTAAGFVEVSYGTRTYVVTVATATALAAPGRRWRLTRGLD